MDFVPHWAGWAQSRPFWTAWEGRWRAFDGSPNLVVNGVIRGAVSWCFVKQEPLRMCLLSEWARTENMVSTSSSFLTWTWWSLEKSVSWKSTVWATLLHCSSWTYWIFLSRWEDRGRSDPYGTWTVGIYIRSPGWISTGMYGTIKGCHPGPEMLPQFKEQQIGHFYKDLLLLQEEEAGRELQPQG